jgi:hypothetical protein
MNHATPDVLLHVAHYGLSVVIAIVGTIFLALGVLAHRRSAPGALPSRDGDDATATQRDR